MKIHVVPAKQLTPDLVTAWARLQQADPAVDSPYFRPEFTQAVASVCEGVEVAVLEEGGEAAGFFPFQRGRWNVGRPVGDPLSDFQGVVARKGLAWTAEELIGGCGLSAWHFGHLLASQQPFQPHHTSLAVSPYLDLSNGFDAYRAGRRPAGGKTITETLRKGRQLSREMGPVRFEAHTADKKVFATLLEWKTAQYLRTKSPNVLALGWPVRLLERILGEQGEAFAGMLSALYVGDWLIAIELAMRSYGVLHGWFPAYDQTFARYSPGHILMAELAKAAPSLGIRRFDLGKGGIGGEQYKMSFASGVLSVAQGSVVRNRVVRVLRRGWQHTRAWARSSPLCGPARVVRRWLRPVGRWLATRAARAALR
jgi:CelD/BcsL family acetyltransferase involved in cellulose biosynthesis